MARHDTSAPAPRGTARPDPDGPVPETPLTASAPPANDLADVALHGWLVEHPGWVGAAVLAIAFVESFAVAGVVVPGVALLAGAAFVAGGGALELSTTLACAFAGAVLGDGSSFLIGRGFAPAVRRSAWMRRHPEWLERGERFFERHGVAGIVLGRFLGPIRPVMPLIAGMMHMRPRLFLSVNLLSALAWAPAYILPGYLVGASLAQAIEPPRAWPVVTVVLAGGLWFGGLRTLDAWRAGAVGGALQRRLAGGPLDALARPLAGGGRDTAASLLAAAAVVMLQAGLLAALLALPAAEDWRRFGSDLLGVLRAL
jgi:membrane protein DedA with SNARE-associated domain